MISFFVGIGILAIELGPTFIKNTALYRTWVPRIVFLLIQAVLTAMFYQVRPFIRRFSLQPLTGTLSSPNRARTPQFGR